MRGLPTKKKLMVVVGAGASIDLGMPTVNDIDQLFSQWAQDYYQLACDGGRNLYGYIRDEINHYYDVYPISKRKTNYEEVLYVMLQLSAMLGDASHDFPINAFSGLKVFPHIMHFGKEATVNSHQLRQLCCQLIDELVKEFRRRCKEVRCNHPEDFKRFESFIKQLNEDFDVAFITLNYDNLITQACPSLFTGFNEESGLFSPSSVYDRTEWGLIYHLHGSVHFGMNADDQIDMHAIRWNKDLHSTFDSDSFGRNSQRTMEKWEVPTSVIVAGYGKMDQIQRVPFRTYYSRLDQISINADALLFIGYGFNDYHLNNSFLYTVRKSAVKRPVVILDWASDHEDPMQYRADAWSHNLRKAIPVNAHQMATTQYDIAPCIRELKLQNEFEVSKNPDYPLSIWYGGFKQAWSNYGKIKAELEVVGCLNRK